MPHFLRIPRFYCAFHRFHKSIESTEHTGLLCLKLSSPSPSSPGGAHISGVQVRGVLLYTYGEVYAFVKYNPVYGLGLTLASLLTVRGVLASIRGEGPPLLRLLGLRDPRFTSYSSFSCLCSLSLAFNAYMIEVGI